jgi:hypothetical protein
MAHYSGLTITETEDALKVLSEEDKYSRTQELGGKRVVKTPDGWRVVNYILYRDRMTKEERRDYKRVKQAEYRDRDSKTPVPSVPVVDEFGDPIAAEAQPLAAPSLVSDQAVRRKAPSRISAPRPQDPLFNALAEECGVIGKPGKALGGEIGTALADMKAQRDMVLTESDIRSAAKAYRAKWPKMTMSPSALAKWMSTLNGKTQDIFAMTNEELTKNLI